MARPTTDAACSCWRSWKKPNWPSVQWRPRAACGWTCRNAGQVLRGAGTPAVSRALPDIEISMSEASHFIDLISEGVDCVLRSGNLGDSSLVGRRVANLRQVTCASPAYLRKYGEPQNLADLSRHQGCELRFQGHRQAVPVRVHRGRRATGSAPGGPGVGVRRRDLCRFGRLRAGLIQVPYYRVAEQIGQGLLKEVCRTIRRRRCRCRCSTRRTGICRHGCGCSSTGSARSSPRPFEVRHSPARSVGKSAGSSVAPRPSAIPRGSPAPGSPPARRSPGPAA